MTYAESILPEFDQEMASTRKVLERVGEDKLEWRAHPKLNTIGWNANHLAEIPGWVEGWLTAPSWDFAPVGGEPYQSPKLTSRREILNLFDRNVAAARRAIAAVKDEEMGNCGRCCIRGKHLHPAARDVALPDRVSTNWSVIV